MEEKNQQSKNQKLGFYPGSDCNHFCDLGRHLLSSAVTSESINVCFNRDTVKEPVPPKEYRTVIAIACGTIIMNMIKT